MHSETPQLQPITPAYRFAYFHPRSEGGETSDGGIDLDSFKLMYHTVGLILEMPDLPIKAYFNYTLTMEEQPRELDNDRLEVLLQLTF